MKLLSISSLVCNEFNKFNFTGGCMLDSLYHNDNKIALNSNFGVKHKDFVIMFTAFLWMQLHNITICKPLVIYLFNTWH